MKRIITFIGIALILLLSYSINAQNNWTLSMSGFDQTFSPNDFVVQSNGDIYIVCSKYDSGINGFIPKLYKSTNQGSSWSEIVTTGLVNLGNTHSLAISSNTMILAGMAVNSANGAKIFTSIDNGVNWTLSMTGFDQTYSPSDFVSNSNGDIYINGVKYDNGINGFVNKLFKSTNQGTNWVEISTTGLTNLGNVHSLAISGSTMILAGMDINSANGAKIFTSTDNGVNWTLSMTGFDQTYSPSDFVTNSNGDIYINGVKYDNGINGFVNKLFKSTNQGTNWAEISTTGLTNLGNVHSLAISGNTMILAGMDVNSANGAKIFTSAVTVNSMDDLLLSKFKIYPNPVIDILHIELAESCQKKIRAKLFSSIGKELLCVEFNSNQLINKTISLRNQNKGIYLLVIESSNEVVSYKIVKN